MANKEIQKNVDIRNKRANFEYQILDTYIAGIQLRGTEIKAIRMSKVNFADAYCLFQNDGIYVKNLNISEYLFASFFKHDPTRERKLLLKKKEINKLKEKSEEKSLTIIPLRIFINDRGWAKLEIALAKGKKIHDKRDTIKERDLSRQIEQE